MNEPSYFETPEGRRIAYRKTEGTLPGVVFLGGFMSDMDGTKAQALEAWAWRRGRAYLRFDYSGHGRSSGAFTDGCIGDWAEDARALIEWVTEGPQVLVGSSMGGWIAAILARDIPDKVAAFVGIAAAPDFTEDSMWRGFTDAERAALMRDGRVELASDYGEPYPITRRLIEDGRDRLVLRAPLRINVPVRLLQGADDASVERAVALGLFDHIDGDDVRLTLVKHADHGFSSPDALALIEATLDEVLG